jgi:hypothetical protein
MDDLQEIKTKLNRIEKLLMGNGVIGVTEMARRSFEYCQELKRSKNGLLDWAYRILIGAMLSYMLAQSILK